MKLIEGKGYEFDDSKLSEGNFSIQNSSPETTTTEIIIPNKDPFYEPSNKEIDNMAISLGIDLKNYPQLKDLVVKAIRKPLPENWGYLKNRKGEVFCIDLETQDIKNENPQLESFRKQAQFLTDQTHHDNSSQKIESQNQTFNSLKFDQDIQSNQPSIKYNIQNSFDFQPEEKSDDKKKPIITFNNLNKNEQNIQDDVVQDILQKINSMYEKIQHLESKINNQNKLQFDKQSNQNRQQNSNLFLKNSQRFKKDIYYIKSNQELQNREVNEEFHDLKSQMGDIMQKLQSMQNIPNFNKQILREQSQIYQSKKFDCENKKYKTFKVNNFNKWMKIVVDEKQSLERFHQKLSQMKKKIHQKKLNQELLRKDLKEYIQSDSKKLYKQKIIQNIKQTSKTQHKEIKELKKKFHKEKTIFNLQKIYLKNFEKNLIETTQLGQFDENDEKYFQNLYKKFRDIINLPKEEIDDSFDELSINESCDSDQRIDFNVSNRNQSVKNLSKKMQNTQKIITNNYKKKIQPKNEYYQKSEAKVYTDKIRAKYNIPQRKRSYNRNKSVNTSQLQNSVVSQFTNNVSKRSNRIKSQSKELRVQSNRPNFLKNTYSQKSTIFKDVRHEVTDLLNNVQNNQFYNKFNFKNINYSKSIIFFSTDFNSQIYFFLS